MKNTRLKRHEFRAIIKDVYSMAELCGMTDTKVNELIKARVWDELESRTAHGARRYPNTLKAYLSGYVWALRESVWQKVEFCYLDDNGDIYSTNDTSAHKLTRELYAQEKGADMRKMKSAFLWIKTGKNFTEWKTQ